MNTIIIVSRNNLHLTKRAVRSALCQDVPVEVLLFDNASTDGTLAWAHSKPISIISYNRQMALSACWNRSIEHFWDMGETHTLVCNNDIELRPDTYSYLHRSDLPFVTAVGVDDIKQAVLPDKFTVSPHPDFSCFMIRKQVTNKVGWFDESYYPAFYEDNDYHVRMHRAGIDAVSVNLPFYHAGSQTIKLADEGERAMICRGADANKERFSRKYGCVPGTPEYDKLFT